jgi:chromosome segregation ATPase
MLNFLAGLGKDKTNEVVSIPAASLDEFELEAFDIELAPVPEKDQMHRSLFKTEVENLMNSVKQQSVEISCQFASFANWSSEIEMLSARAATLQPLLTKLIEENTAQAAAIAEFERAKEIADQRISGLETEVDHFRPLAARLEEELSGVKEKYSSAQNMLSALEGQFAQHHTENNELIYALAKAESKATRASEENMAFRQKAQEHNAVIQNQMREVADLKSAISTKYRELQKQEELVADLSAKLAAAQQTGSHSASTLSSVLMREAQTEKELQTRLSESREQLKDMMQKLANRDKQLNAAEVKIAGLNTKIEFLTQLTQKLRDDMHLNTDQMNMIEKSSRQLAEGLARRDMQETMPDGEANVTKEARPKLRAVQMSAAPRMPVETPVRTHRVS